jgi:hypothetical protein
MVLGADLNYSELRQGALVAVVCLSPPAIAQKWQPAGACSTLSSRLASTFAVPAAYRIPGRHHTIVQIGMGLRRSHVRSAMIFAS